MASGMERLDRKHGHRLRPLLVVGGMTLGILILFGLQFLLPYILGPWGLVVVGLMDLAIFLELRHRRTVRRLRRERGRSPRIPGDRRSVDHHVHPLEDELLVAIAFVVFVIGYVVEGIGLGADAWSPGVNPVLVVVGTVITVAAYVALRGTGWTYYGWTSGGWRYGTPPSESEQYDTTDDH